MAIGSVYRPFLEVARDAGVDVTAELARFGIHEDGLSEARLAPHQGRALVLRLAAKSGVHELGLTAAARARITDLDLLGYLAKHSEHALAALEMLVRYPQLLGDTAASELLHTQGHVAIRFGLTGGRQMLPDGSDYAIGVMVRVLLEISDGEAQPVEVHLPRARPRRPGKYRDFFGVMPSFGAERAVLRYPKRTLLRPIPDRDRRLHRILEERASESMAALPQPADWIDRVRGELIRALTEGRAELGNVATRCGMSERTLRRHLDAAGTSFRSLTDDVRRAHALQLIDEGQTRVIAIAQACGYNDATAFARAFRRWTGLSPQRYLATRRPGDYPLRGGPPFAARIGSSQRQAQ